MGDVAQVDAQRRQHPRQSQRQQGERQHAQRQPQRRRRRQPAQHQVEREPDRQPDGEVEQRAAEAHHGQEVEREDDLPHEVRVADDQRRRALQRLGQHPVQQQPDEEHEREVGAAPAAGERAPARREHLGEEQRVDGEHQHRVERHPEQAARGAAVARPRVALGHLPDEVPVAPQAAQERDRAQRDARARRRHLRPPVRDAVVGPCHSRARSAPLGVAGAGGRQRPPRPGHSSRAAAAPRGARARRSPGAPC